MNATNGGNEMDAFRANKVKKDAAHAAATNRAKSETDDALRRMRDNGFRFHVSANDVRDIVEGK